MRIISHRGNLDGPNSNENTAHSIDLAILKDFDVEIDVWEVDGLLFIGHDEPILKIDYRWLRDRACYLWVHCKNLGAIEIMNMFNYNIPYFWHQNDDFTLTSNGYIWTYPGKSLCHKSIAVLPELPGTLPTDIYAICTDFPEKYKELYKL